MCGIAGFYDGNINREEAGALLDRMLESIKHRGPDNRGIWTSVALALGHNRLSIIDLSDDANQPMEYEGYIITYNGEIYNYLEIREQLIKKGYSFKTHSDTEVILAAYREWKEKCVDYFVGMWAFAIWDKNTQALFCSRDRFGIKPFYYIHSGNRFYFASEYKPLKLSPLFSKTINLGQVYRGLQLGWITYHDETYFEIIKQLPAAHNLIFANGNLSVRKYWDVNLSENKKDLASVAQMKEHQEKFRQLFLESVKIHTRSDVTVGGCLSGGIDSSSIASGVATMFPGNKFKTFTIFYDEKGDVDERPWVNKVTGQYKNLEPYFYSPSDTDIQQSFDKVMYHADVPLPGSSPFSQYFLMRLAREQNVKVVLDGQGADEYLAGYMHTYDRVAGALIKNLDIFGVMNLIRSLQSNYGYSSGKALYTIAKGSLSSVQHEQAFYAYAYKHLFPFLPAHNQGSIPFHLKERSNNKLNEFLYHLLFNTSLPNLLHYEDRNSMAFSIESRVPFLDHRLVEYAFSLSDNEKINNTETKVILRKSLDGILPSAIANRRDKKGFVTPGEAKWLRGPLKNLMEIDYNNLSFLNIKTAKSVIDDYQKGNNKNALLVWRLAVLNYWMKKNV